MSTTTSTTTTDRRRAGKGKTAEERAAEVEALAEQLTDAVAALTSSAAWVSMLRVAARFTRYRVGRSGLFQVRECPAQLVGRGCCQAAGSAA